MHLLPCIGFSKKKNKVFAVCVCLSKIPHLCEAISLCQWLLYLTNSFTFFHYKEEKPDSYPMNTLFKNNACIKHGLSKIYFWVHSGNWQNSHRICSKVAFHLAHHYIIDQISFTTEYCVGVWGKHALYDFLQNFWITASKYANERKFSPYYMGSYVRFVSWWRLWQYVFLT